MRVPKDTHSDPAGSSVGALPLGLLHPSTAKDLAAGPDTMEEAYDREIRFFAEIGVQVSHRKHQTIRTVTFSDNHGTQTGDSGGLEDPGGLEASDELEERGRHRPGRRGNVSDDSQPDEGLDGEFDGDLDDA